jgi:hypothetical protein
MMCIVKGSFQRCCEFGECHVPQDPHFLWFCSEINSGKGDGNYLKHAHHGRCRSEMSDILRTLLVWQFGMAGLRVAAGSARSSGDVTDGWTETGDRGQTRKRPGATIDKYGLGQMRRRTEAVTDWWGG